MRFCVFALLLFVAYNSFAHQQTLSDIRSQWKLTEVALRNECMRETGIKQEAIDDFYNYGKIPEDPCWKCFIKCFIVKLKILKPTGEVDSKKWSQTFHYMNLPLAQKCANIVEPDLCEKAQLLLKCAYDNLSKGYLP